MEKRIEPCLTNAHASEKLIRWGMDIVDRQSEGGKIGHSGNFSYFCGIFYKLLCCYSSKILKSLINPEFTFVECDYKAENFWRSIFSVSLIVQWTARRLGDGLLFATKRRGNVRWTFLTDMEQRAGVKIYKDLNTKYNKDPSPRTRASRNRNSDL